MYLFFSFSHARKIREINNPPFPHVSSLNPARCGFLPGFMPFLGSENVPDSVIFITRLALPPPSGDELRERLGEEGRIICTGFTLYLSFLGSRNRLVGCLLHPSTCCLHFFSCFPFPCPPPLALVFFSRPSPMLRLCSLRCSPACCISNSLLLVPSGLIPFPSAFSVRLEVLLDSSAVFLHSPVVPPG